MKKSILIVDDDAVLIEELKDALEGEGFAVTTAMDGFKGSELIEKSYYDIALLDIKMPGPSGIELIERMKERNPSSRVFFMSGKPFLDKFIKEDNRAAEITGFFSKPFSMEKLVKEIKR